MLRSILKAALERAADAVLLDGGGREGEDAGPDAPEALSLFIDLLTSRATPSASPPSPSYLLAVPRLMDATLTRRAATHGVPPPLPLELWQHVVELGAAAQG